jgi:hypothetical protein
LSHGTPASYLGAQNVVILMVFRNSSSDRWKCRLKLDRVDSFLSLSFRVATVRNKSLKVLINHK